MSIFKNKDFQERVLWTVIEGAVGVGAALVQPWTNDPTYKGAIAVAVMALAAIVKGRIGVAVGAPTPALGFGDKLPPVGEADPSLPVPPPSDTPAAP